MFPAARKGDTLTHDLLVPSGIIGPPMLGPCPSGLVIIEGLPAAHVTCTAVCIGTTSFGLAHPPPPGPPPPVITGSLTVLIHSKPASRWFPSGDMSACGAFLGDPKLFATRTVLIGGPTIPMSPVVVGPTSTSYGTSITIEGTPEYQAKVVRDLRIIESTPSGRKLLASLEASGKTLRIHSDAGKGNWAWTDPPPTGANPPGYLRANGTAGAKANTEIGYNPDRTSVTGPPGSPYNTAPWAQSPNRPADVGLYHEMVHADDMMKGGLDNSNGVNTGARAGQQLPNSELRAAGLGPYSGQPLSENAYRNDRGLPARTFY